MGSFATSKDGAELTRMRLTDSKTTSTGVLTATYQPRRNV
jgi:hypothetical protein